MIIAGNMRAKIQQAISMLELSDEIDTNTLNTANTLILIAIAEGLANIGDTLENLEDSITRAQFLTCR